MARRLTRRVDHQYFIRSTPRKVFRAVSDPEWLTRWMCDGAEFTPRKGARYALWWTNGPRHTGTIVAFRPEQRISYSWAWEGVPVRGTRLQFWVEPSRGGAILHVQHLGFPASAKWADLYGGAEWGWTYFALNLKSVLERGHDLRSPQDG